MMNRRGPQYWASCTWLLKRSHVCTEGVNHFINVTPFCDQKGACFLQCRRREGVGGQTFWPHIPVFFQTLCPPRALVISVFGCFPFKIGEENSDNSEYLRNVLNMPDKWPSVKFNQMSGREPKMSCTAQNLFVITGPQD